MSYDAVGRVSSVTDEQGISRKFRYDDADRLIAIDYPDGTKSSIKYDRLDAVAFETGRGVNQGVRM